MKKIISKHILAFPVIISLLFMQVTVLAQADEKSEKEKLQAIQNEIANIYNNKMEEALKKNKNEFNKMKEDAEAIDKIKDENGKKNAIDNYQKVHKGYYMKMMNTAGVKINSILAHLKKKFPEYSFTSPDEISIDIEKKTETLSTESSDVGFIGESETETFHVDSDISGPHSTDNNFYSNVIQENITLASSKKINCSLLSGGSVSFPATNSMRAASFATIGGGCDASGILERSFTVPTNIRYFKVLLSGSVQHNGYAVGVGGSAISRTRTTVYIISPLKTLYYFSMERQKFAPILWAAGYNETANLYGNVYLTSYKSQNVKIRAITYAYNISVLPSATKSNCQIKLPTLLKVFERD